MTGAMAVGSTDERYLCKDCGYRGAFILDDATDSKEPPVDSSRAWFKTGTAGIIGALIAFGVVTLLGIGIIIQIIAIIVGALCGVSIERLFSDEGESTEEVVDEDLKEIKEEIKAENKAGKSLKEP